MQTHISEIFRQTIGEPSSSTTATWLLMTHQGLCENEQSMIRNTGVCSRPWWQPLVIDKWQTQENCYNVEEIVIAS